MAEPIVTGVTGTLEVAAVAALTGWVRAEGIGSEVSDVAAGALPRADAKSP
ncbi:MAG: hypothetical protein K0U67_10840 [Actinomycetia bacterium]|nr:hypothetical protein [Actinomycetes bacterium]